MLEVLHIFKGFITYVYVLMFFILFTLHEHIYIVFTLLLDHSSYWKLINLLFFVIGSILSCNKFNHLHKPEADVYQSIPSPLVLPHLS